MAEPSLTHLRRPDAFRGGCVVVATGAASLDPRAVAAVPPEAFIVAADGGLDHALGAGLEPDVLIGDLDSVSPAGLAWATEHARVEQHPVDKALTDTELAIEFAAALEPRTLVLIAGPGDRLDHAVAALGALGADELAAIPVVEAWWGADHVFVAHPDRPVTLTEPAGTTFSVLASHGPCHGVTVSGARWPLDHADLGPLVGLGVSNQVAEPPVHIHLTHGTLTVIVPGAQP